MTIACNSKLFDLFNSNFKIMFLLQKTLCLYESYYDPEYTSSLLFDDKIVHHFYE